MCMCVCTRVRVSNVPLSDLPAKSKTVSFISIYKKKKSIKLSSGHFLSMHACPPHAFCTLFPNWKKRMYVFPGRICNATAAWLHLSIMFKNMLSGHINAQPQCSSSKHFSAFPPAAPAITPKSSTHGQD